jgi:hypothetical protein
VGVRKSLDSKFGFYSLLIFSVAQHARDEQLIRSFIDYLNCGNVTKKKQGIIHFTVTKFSDIIACAEKIIPFFKKYPILGEKSKDFHDFCQVANMMIEKKHLSEDGLDTIKNIKAGMNRGS